MKKMINPGSHIIADLIDKGSEGVEIGVWIGDTTEKFAAKASLVHAVDAYDITVFGEDEFEKLCARYSKLYNIEPTKEGFAKFYDNIYQGVVDRFEGRNVQVYRMNSTEWFAQNTKTDYDWIYVDGDHSYDGCLRDLNNAWDVIRKGGVMYGDDLNSKKGVRMALQEFGHQYVDLGLGQWKIEK